MNGYACVACKRKLYFCNRPLQSPEINSGEHFAAASSCDSQALAQRCKVCKTGRTFPAENWLSRGRPFPCAVSQPSPVTGRLISAAKTRTATQHPPLRIKMAQIHKIISPGCNQPVGEKSSL